MKIGYFLNSLFRSKRINFDKKLKILVKTIVLIVKNELFETAKTRQNAKLSHLLIPSTEKAKKIPPKFCEKCIKEKRSRTHNNWWEKNPTYMRFYMRDYRDRKKKLPKVHDGET